MTTIVTRAGKGSPLTFTEADANFTNLNTNKPEIDGTVAFNAGTAAAPSVHVGTEESGFYAATGLLHSAVAGVNFSSSYKAAYADVHAIGMATPYTDWSWASSAIKALTVGQYGEAAVINDTNTISYFSHGMYIKGAAFAYTNTGGVTPAWIKMSGGQISFVGSTASGTAGNTVTGQTTIFHTDPSYTGTTSGALVLDSGCIAFPAVQVPSTNANTLDDYEEGTWTPAIAFGGGTTGLTYGGQTGTYTKIGRKVTCFARILLTAKGSSTGSMTITGLPFAAAGYSEVSPIDGAAGTTFTTLPYVVASGSTGYCFYNNRGAAVTDAQMSNTSDIRFSFTYEV